MTSGPSASLGSDAFGEPAAERRGAASQFRMPETTPFSFEPRAASIVYSSAFSAALKIASEQPSTARARSAPSGMNGNGTAPADTNGARASYFSLQFPPGVVGIVVNTEKVPLQATE